MTLKNLSLLWKVNCLLAMLGIFAFGAIAFAGSQMASISASYDRLIGGEIEVARLIASANRDLAWTERSMLQLIWSTSEDTNRQFMQEMDEAARHFATTMGAAQQALPARAAEFETFLSRFERAYKGDCAVAARMGSESTTLEGNGKAMAEMNRACAKNLAALSRDTTRLAEQFGNAAAQTEKTLGRDVANTVSSTYLIVLLGFALILIAAALVTKRGMVRPVRELISLMTAMTEGDLQRQVPGADRKDELGAIARAIELFRVGLSTAEERRLQAEAAGLHAVVRRREEMQNLANQFESAVGEIVGVVSSSSAELEIAAHTLTKTAAGTQELSALVAVASGEASTNVQSVASSSEEMAASVNEIGQQVQHSARIASEAVNQVSTTNDRVNALSHAATRISEVVELINNIASQTNLLALNATIEAARAGEAGRGFAVVASEVKALAGQTAKATGEISEQIAGVQAATRESVAAIQEISRTILQVSEIASAISSSVEEQGTVTREISRNILQAAHGAQQVASNIANVRRGATETGSASSQVLSAAQSLSAESRRLKLEVGKFLATVRAA